MEDSLAKLNKVEHIFLSEVFENACPYFMAIGMTYNEFWKEDPTMTKMYNKAYKIKQEIIEWNMWEEGMYTYEALCKVSPVLHAFAQKGTKPLPFSKEPYGLKKIKENDEEKDNKPDEQQIKNERMKAEIFFNNWFKATKNQFKKESR